jgi:hypothetical protein
MSRYGSNFREPPWVMGSPKEVQDWMDASHPSKKKEDKHKFEKEFLKNLHIKFDFDVKTKVIKKGFFSEVIEEDFGLLPTTELILRGLAKAKFKNLAKLVVDGKTIYEHPEKKTDLRKTINDISDFSNQISNAKNVEIESILDDVHKCTAIIKINKVHKTKQHSIEIKMNGQIHKDIYHTFLNYLKEKIGLKDQ